MSSMEPLFRVVSERDNFRKGISLATAWAGSGVFDLMVCVGRPPQLLDSIGVIFVRSSSLHCAKDSV